MDLVGYIVIDRKFVIKSHAVALSKDRLEETDPFPPFSSMRPPAVAVFYRPPTTPTELPCFADEAMQQLLSPVGAHLHQK